MKTKTFKDYEDHDNMALIVTSDDGLVTLELNEGTRYLEFTPAQTVRLAEYLLRAARKLGS